MSQSWVSVIIVWFVAFGCIAAIVLILMLLLRKDRW